MQHPDEEAAWTSTTAAARPRPRSWTATGNELLQELRVSQTGVQILTGFLLTLPLQTTFARLTTFERNTYVAAIAFSILATCLLIAPVAMHRILFRERRKGTLVDVGSSVAKAGLAMLALATPGGHLHHVGDLRPAGGALVRSRGPRAVRLRLACPADAHGDAATAVPTAERGPR